MHVSLVLPAYNEASHLPRVIPDLQREFTSAVTSFEIIVVDNGSVDETEAVLRTLQRDIPELVVVRVTPNRGFGGGIRAGLEKTRGDVVGWVGADDQLTARDIVDVYREMVKANAPFAKGNRVFENRPSFLWFRSRVYTAFFNLFFGHLTDDAQGTPKFFNRALYERMNLTSGDWFIDSESIIKGARLGVRPTERPVSWRTRTSGKSKVQIRTTFEFIKNVLYYRFFD